MGGTAVTQADRGDPLMRWKSTIDDGTIAKPSQWWAQASPRLQSASACPSSCARTRGLSYRMVSVWKGRSLSTSASVLPAGIVLRRWDVGIPYPLRSNERPCRRNNCHHAVERPEHRKSPPEFQYRPDATLQRQQIKRMVHFFYQSPPRRRGVDPGHGNPPRMPRL